MKHIKIPFHLFKIDKSIEFNPEHSATFEGHENDFQIETNDFTFASSHWDYVDKFQEIMSSINITKNLLV